AAVTGAKLGYLSEGANAAGAALAGVLPHRGVGGRALAAEGLHAHAMMAAPRRTYVLFGVEPDEDLVDGALAEQALKSADRVIAFTSFASESLLDCADILLPVAAFAETDGTYVNAEGRWQSFGQAADAPGETRAGWRVLRVLGNALALPDCDYRSAADVRDALLGELGGTPPAGDNGYRGRLEVTLDPVSADLDALDVPIYSIDPLVRRSEPLQHTVLAEGEEEDVSKVRTA